MKFKKIAPDSVIKIMFILILYWKNCKYINITHNKVRKNKLSNIINVQRDLKNNIPFQYFLDNNK